MPVSSKSTKGKRRAIEEFLKRERKAKLARLKALGDAFKEVAGASKKFVSDVGASK